MVSQSVDPDETVYARSDGAALIEADREKAGVVRFNDPSLGVVEFDKFADARLYFGLWQLVAGFPVPPADNHVPISVATEGRGALAAFLLVGRGERRSTEYVRDEMGLETTQSVRNHTNEVRWTPEKSGTIEK